tara:strand:- start:159 stop:515 length:357 start_codon:yes stop_codon:yes gene_type:complete
MQSNTLIEEAEEVLNEEEEDPAWVKAGQNVLANPMKGLKSENKRLKKLLKEAQQWKPRPQHEVVEITIALQRRQNKLLMDQNKLFAIMIETLEENLDKNSFTTMHTYRAKQVVEQYDW